MSDIKPTASEALSVDFKCPHCKADEFSEYIKEVSPSDYNSMPPIAYDKVELWRCLECGKLFFAYYNLVRIAKLYVE